MFPPDQALSETDNESSLTRTEHDSTEVNGNDLLNASVGKKADHSLSSSFYEYTSIKGEKKAFKIFKYF